MCDYSLEYVASRPAVAADRLVTTNFTGTSTRGFAGIGDLNTAVCLRPGTEIAFDSAPRYENPLYYAPPKQARCETARFRQIDLEKPHVHHDALEFADGTIVPLARLIQGQWATVLQLPSVPLNTVDMVTKEAVDTTA
jgi:hypothetical protein